jgi:toxin ParE1/3/4
VTKVLFTAAAIQDLKAIYSYIADENLDAAARFLKRLQKRWLGLAERPGIGRRRNDLLPELRSAGEGDYVIFYRKTAEGVELIRVLHGKRDAEQIFQES